MKGNERGRGGEERRGGNVGRRVRDERKESNKYKRRG